MLFDLIVVGAGHAGIEAAHVAAGQNSTVLLIANNLDLIGQMSCNPAIGGIAKGNIVREIDALGGLMGRLIDRTGMHFRMLNTSKGAAVWGPRAQADKVAYRAAAKAELEKQETLFMLQGMVTGILEKGGAVSGVVMDSGEKIFARVVILAMGTFLNGLMHIGLESHPAGRSGEPPSAGLTESIAGLGIKSGRLKTGTSPRIDGRTVNYDCLEAQPGDDQPQPFSFSTNEPLRNRVVCWTTKSNPRTHAIIKENLDRSPLYTGKIKSIGPRYCPSIEDKVVRFGERDGHVLFLEPESRSNNELYLNGLSTSLPFDVQRRLVGSVRGLENARILRPGYGIEYDFFPPVQLRNTLESRTVRGLYFAGQINGTSGYEEAACQGLVAGINAVLTLRGGASFTLGRETSYIGVLIDDLVTRGTDEPYRMFTSRAEYRLRLRQDNCDERLMPIAFKLGLVRQELYDRRRRGWESKAAAAAVLGAVRIEPATWGAVSDEPITQPTRAIELLRRPAVTLEMLMRCGGLTAMPESAEQRFSLECDVKYSGFLAREEAVAGRMALLGETPIPEGFDYRNVRGLLTESFNKLTTLRPSSIGQASRISGITPADIALLALHLTRKNSTHRDGRRETANSIEERETT
jgi:tRNA uridine 5-carboxymethylaminomethyl modification enzyme